MKLPSVYEPGKYESETYTLWEKSRVFIANPNSDKPHFSISMPPPNETGTLHVGHALFLTLQDILARRARQEGKDVLWLPGTDHAALATNAIIEKQLTEQGTNKHELGREAFIEKVMEFVGDSRNTINTQIRAMGASCDWSRARYTLDEALNRCVNEFFVKMYNDELIYRGHRIVNWDPNLETTVSDDEVVYKEEAAPFYTLQFGPFQIGTARPETKFGDKFVVMHPDDQRYKDYKQGDKFETEWINGPITATVIKDEAVNPDFGTGVMTITPWHDHTDFDIAERHKLDKEQIIDFKGKLLPIAGEFAGMGIDEARPKIVEKLVKKGLQVDVDENYTHNVAYADRGKGVIEPQIKLQWFIDVNKKVVDWKGSKHSLKEVMRAVIDDKDIDIIPERFEKVYFHWIDNLRDWCISRQIWWGHRIPVWYKDSEIYTGVKPPQDEGWEQDPDTLDTWFSSALWTWSTLIDPDLAGDYSLSLQDLLDKSIDFQTYHPTDVMETGWDILFFWVARMILATTYATDEVPFKTVYLHGLVRTEEGKKMSKSNPESIVDPMEVIPKYGTDALRLALVAGTAAGNDQRLGMSKIVANRNFCNKLWNIARYIEGSVEDWQKTSEIIPKTAADHWILNKLSNSNDDIKEHLDNFRFSEAYDALYHFVWDDFADWYVEASKIDPNKPLLKFVLEMSLVLAHPFAPFISEAIWQNLGWDEDTMLAAQTLPQIPKANPQASNDFEELKLIITEARRVKAATATAKPKLTYDNEPLIEKNKTLIQKLAGLSSISTVEAGHRGIKLVMSSHNAWLAADQQTANKYLSDLKKSQEEIAGQIKKLESRLTNKAYVSNAPSELIEQTKSELEAQKAKLRELEAEIKAFA